MGSDDLFHKRKAKSAKELARRKAKRASYERVLVICEGAKTEPNYLREMIDYLELNTANVTVDGNYGSSPASVFEAAKVRYNEEKRLGEQFDRVFCVFDKDNHSTYTQALAAIRKARPTDTFAAINSVPCFEFWLLLHFVFTAKPYSVAGAKSACACVIDDLHKYMPDYSKGDEGVFRKLMGQTAQAIAWSKNVLNEARKNATDNPSTLMHELVEYLQQLKNKPGTRA